MKRFFLFFSIVVFCGTASYAQRNTFQNELYVGVGGGALFSSVDFVPTIPQTLMMGVHGGLAVKYISEKHLGLIAEINYAQRGWTEEFDPAEEFSYSRRLNYLELPFMTHIYFGNKIRFIVNVGPQISILLNDDQQMNQALADDLAARRAANPDAQIGVQYGAFNEMNRVDYGLIGGVGMELKTGIGDFDLEGRYYFGLGDVFISRRSDNAYFSRSAHRLIEAKLTYYLKIH
ncbi:MAG: porin family protein [Proteiniphilum sp.]